LWLIRKLTQGIILIKQFYITELRKYLPEVDLRLVAAIKRKTKLKKRFLQFNILIVLLSLAFSIYVFVSLQDNNYIFLSHLLILLVLVYSNYKTLIEVFTLRERVTSGIKVIMRVEEITSTSSKHKVCYSLEELQTMHNHLISDELALSDIKKNSLLVGLRVVEL
jgi:hypothetical protein